MAKNKITVSELFVEIYMNFNVTDQVENIKMLGPKEMYLLMIYVIDRHSEENPVVVKNLNSFQKEIMELHRIMDDRPTENPIIMDLISETGDRYIETDNVVDKNGRKLKSPLTQQQVRQEKIKRIRKK
jgi:hypothetical protein